MSAAGMSQPDGNPVEPGSAMENRRANFIFGQTIDEEACTLGVNPDDLTRRANTAVEAFKKDNREAWAQLQAAQETPANIPTIAAAPTPHPASRWKRMLAGAMAGLAQAGQNYQNPTAANTWANSPSNQPARPASDYTTTFVTPGLAPGSYNTTSTDGSGHYIYGMTYVQPSVDMSLAPPVVKSFHQQPTYLQQQAQDKINASSPSFQATPPAPPLFNAEPQKPRCTTALPLISPTKGLYFGCLDNH
ncbi:MAG TPA: hypothetical protein VFN53_01755 [Acidobacteriaceae bacterium]|nr:hypothetical protein [Acidobacteriaceae bacterium]